MFSLDTLFCHVDDFCKAFESQWRKKLLINGGIRRIRARSLCLSEMMTILIAFHQNHYRNFKYFYLNQVKQYWSSAFPGLPSYQRFTLMDTIDLDTVVRATCYKSGIARPTQWLVYLKHCFGTCTGIGLIDSTCLKVCHNRRISRTQGV